MGRKAILIELNPKYAEMGKERTRWSVPGADSMLAVRTTLLNQDRVLLHQMARAT